MPYVIETVVPDAGCWIKMQPVRPTIALVSVGFWSVKFVALVAVNEKFMPVVKSGVTDDVPDRGTIPAAEPKVAPAVSTLFDAAL